MKKILYLFLMLIMLGCGKEPEQKEVIAEKNNNVVEKVETKKDETKVEIKKIKEKKFEILEISTNLGENPTVEIKFSEDIRPENVDAYINISPEINFNILTDKNKIILNGDFKAESSYKIEILKEIKSIKGKSLEENEVKTIVFKEREPKIVFSNEGIILPTNNKKIAFRAMNVKEVNLTVKKVYENNITQFLQELAFKGNGNVFDYRIDEEFYKVGDVILSEEYELNYEKNVWQQIEIDLEGLDNYKGMFVVELSFDKEGADYTFPENMDYWEEESFLRNNARIGKAILLTHMGMIAQKDRDKTVVTVMDILKNEPVKDANVKLISTNNQIVSEGKTNNKGEVSLVGNENTMYAIAEKGEEKSILKFSDARLSYDGYAVDGIFTSDGIKTFMYTDRGIYRPGDEIFLSIIARNEEGSFPEGHPITIDVYTPKGQTFIENYVIKDGKEGFYTYSFKTNKDSETGIWRVRAEIGDKIFTKDISVETIVPYKIKVEAKAPEKINLNENKNFSLDIKSNYLFGAPADKLKYNVELDVREKTINFEKYKNYTFKNPTTFKYNFRDYKEGILNENGEAKVEFDISKISPKNINTVGILTTKVIEEGGRPVINKSSIYFNKFDTYVGIKDLEDRWIKTGEKLNLEVIAVSEDGEDLVPGRKLKYRIYRNEYSWWWDYGNRDDFVRSIKTDRNTVLIYEKEFLSEDKPYTIDYPMDGEGEIFVEVEDIETNQSAGITLHSCTWNDSSTNGKIDKLKIETDKKSYVIGDKAKITFEGTEGAKAIIITEKSGRIIDKKIVDANDLKNIYEIEVTEDMFPNSYISVMLLQNYEKLDNDRPIRLYGAVPIIVKDEAKKLNIKIDAPKEVMPNEEFVVKVKNEEKEKMNYTIAIVDEGILDITDFKTPDPFGYFYQKEAMQIDFYDNYSEIMGRIIGKVHGVLKTGGDGFINEARKLSLSSRSKDLGIEDNERFKPVAMYKGVLTTDENGEGSVKFTMPNYMGAVKVMVVGASGEKYGNTSSEIVVKAPIVVDTTLPRVLKVGDIFKIPVSVFATEDEVGKVKINLDFMGKEQKETIKFDKKGKKTIYFDVQTPKKVGNEKINISAMSSKYNYKEETNISINSDNPYIYINKIEVLEKGKDLVFKNPSEYVEGTPKGSIIVSNSPILGADKRLSELIRYPYGCGEQIVSAAFPQMYINMLTNNNKFDRKEITGNVNVTIGEISERQLYDGSFPYWPGGDTNIWVTNYTGQFLIEAIDKGYYVPESVYNSWLNFTKKMVKNTDVRLNERVYALYLLAKAEEADISQMNLIYENYLNSLFPINRWYLAAAYKYIGEDKIAKDIVKNIGYEPTEEEIKYYRYSYGSVIRDKAIVLSCYYDIFGEVQKDLYTEIIKTIQGNEWLSTQSMGYTLMTLGKIKKEANKEIFGKIITDGKKIDFKTENGIFVYDMPEDLKTIKIESKDNAFINYYWEGLPINYEMENVSENIKLERKYYDKDGKEIDPKILSQGDSFFMEIKVKKSDDSYGYRYVENVALTQILPTGWEIENIRAVGGSYPTWVEDKIRSTSLDYEDIRDDRVMFFFSFDSMKKDGMTFFIKVNAVTKGKFNFIGTKVEAMYDNNYKAYLKGFDVEVK